MAHDDPRQGLLDARVSGEVHHPDRERAATALKPRHVMSMSW